VVAMLKIQKNLSIAHDFLDITQFRRHFQLHNNKPANYMDHVTSM